MLFGNRADSYRNKKEWDRALADINKAVQLNPKNRRNYYIRGLLFYDQDNYDRAIPEFSQAIRIDPKYDEAYYYRGRSYFLKKEYKSAIPDFTESTKLDPNYAPTWFYRGLSYERLDNLDQALTNYNKAISLDDGHGSARHNRGMIKLGRGDYDGAIEDFTVSIRTSADEITHNSRGVAYRNKGEFQLAMSDFNEAIRFDPKYGRAYYNRGMLHSRAGAADLAVSDLRKVGRTRSAEPRGTRRTWPRRGDGRERSGRAAATATTAATGAAGNRLVAAGSGQRPTGPGARHFARRQARGARDRQWRLSILFQARQSGQRCAGHLQHTCARSASKSWKAATSTVAEWTTRSASSRASSTAPASPSCSIPATACRSASKNYLIPIDAKIERAADLNLDAFDVQRVLDQMEAEKRVNLIFLDACRDNPLTRSLARNSGGGTRSTAVGMGLAPVQSAAGTLIAYATAAEQRRARWRRPQQPVHHRAAQAHGDARSRSRIDDEAGAHRCDLGDPREAGAVGSFVAGRQRVSARSLA